MKQDSFSDKPKHALDIAVGLATALSSYSLAEALFMQVSASWLAESRFLPLAMHVGPTPLVVTILSVGLVLLWTRGKTAIFSSLVGCGLCLVALQRFPGSYPWTGTSVNPYGTGVGYLWPLVISLFVSFLAMFFFKGKRANDLVTALFTTTIYAAAVAFSVFHQSSKPLLETDYNYSRHLSLSIFAPISVLAFPLYLLEEYLYGELD
jgi:hypothetical protein